MSKERKIKFTAIACRWFDRLYGNTYHSVRVTRHRDGKVIACPFTYGYGDCYRQTALEAMTNAKWLPVRYRKNIKPSDCFPHQPTSPLMYERENNYPILWTVSDGLKRDCVANGKL